MRNIIVFIILFSVSGIANAQKDSSQIIIDHKLPWYVSANIGIQMSGIKSEDFTASNFSPLLNVSAGKWISPGIALEAGYQGWYFNTISDSIKHYYTFLFGKIVFNMNKLLSKQKKERVWYLLIQLGSGYFYNNHYNHPNICGTLRVKNAIRLNDFLRLNIDFGAIVGWDIYGGDGDILPSTSAGLTYTFK